MLLFKGASWGASFPACAACLAQLSQCVHTPSVWLKPQALGVLWFYCMREALHDLSLNEAELAVFKLASCAAQAMVFIEYQ